MTRQSEKTLSASQKIITKKTLLYTPVTTQEMTFRFYKDTSPLSSLKDHPLETPILGLLSLSDLTEVVFFLLENVKGTSAAISF